MAKHFDLDEIACHCGCGIANTSPKLEAMADLARDLYGGPLYANSWCRCPHHNEEVGGSRTSSHISTQVKQCTAIDFAIRPGIDRSRLASALLKAGFNRLGIGHGLIHADCDPAKPANEIWFYTNK